MPSRGLSDSVVEHGIAARYGLAECCGYIDQHLARGMGKSRTPIGESLALNRMPEAIGRLCRPADITSKSLLLQVVKQESPAQ